MKKWKGKTEVERRRRRYTMRDKIQHLIKKHRPNSPNEEELVWNVLWDLVDWEKGQFRKDFFQYMSESDKLLVRVSLSIKEKGYTKWMTATWRDFPSSIQNVEWVAKQIQEGIKDVLKNVATRLGVEVE